LNGKREHEEIDSQVFEDDDALETLRQCGIKKSFEMSNMRAQKRILQLLISYWEQNADVFIGDDQSLKIEVEDI